MKDAPRLHRIEYAAYRGLSILLRALPHGASRTIGRGLGRLLYYVAPRRRRLALANLAAVLPAIDPGRRSVIARRSFANLGAAALDTLSAARFDAEQLCERLTIEGWDNLRSAEEMGRGVFIMSAHLGCWEIAALPVGLYRGSFHILNRPLDNPLLDRRLLALRTRFGNRMVDKRGAARELVRLIRQRERIGILIDQSVPPRQGIEVPFFGHPAWTSPILAKLALKHGVPVVPIFGFHAAKGRYRVVFRPPILASDDPPPSLEELTGRYLAAVEEEIRAAPAEWLWMHDRWRRRRGATTGTTTGTGTAGASGATGPSGATGASGAAG